MAVYRTCESCQAQVPIVELHNARDCFNRRSQRWQESEITNAALREENAAQAQRIIALELQLEELHTGTDTQIVTTEWLDRAFPQFAHIPERRELWNEAVCYEAMTGRNMDILTWKNAAQDRRIGELEQELVALREKVCAYGLDPDASLIPPDLRTVCARLELENEMLQAELESCQSALCVNALVGAEA